MAVMTFLSLSFEQCSNVKISSLDSLEFRLVSLQLPLIESVGRLQTDRLLNEAMEMHSAGPKRQAEGSKMGTQKGEYRSAISFHL